MEILSYPIQVELTFLPTPPTLWKNQFCICTPISIFLIYNCACRLDCLLNPL